MSQGELFPVAKIGQNQMILTYLKEGHRISALEALNEFGCFRLASRINDLKNKGHAIQSDWKQVSTRRNGNVMVKEYWL